MYDARLQVDFVSNDDVWREGDGWRREDHLPRVHNHHVYMQWAFKLLTHLLARIMEATSTDIAEMTENCLQLLPTYICRYCWAGYLTTMRYIVCTCEFEA